MFEGIREIPSPMGAFLLSSLSLSNLRGWVCCEAGVPWPCGSLEMLLTPAPATIRILSRGAAHLNWAISCYMGMPSGPELWALKVARGSSWSWSLVLTCCADVQNSQAFHITLWNRCRVQGDGKGWIPLMYIMTWLGKCEKFELLPAWPLLVIVQQIPKGDISSEK